MLDPQDPGTLSLPGVEPLPVVPLRLTGKQIRHAANYLGPKERPSCRSCQHLGHVITFPDSPCEEARPVCERTGPAAFPVHLGGICDYVRDKRAGERF